MGMNPKSLQQNMIENVLQSMLDQQKTQENRKSNGPGTRTGNRNASMNMVQQFLNPGWNQNNRRRQTSSKNTKDQHKTRPMQSQENKKQTLKKEEEAIRKKGLVGAAEVEAEEVRTEAASCRPVRRYQAPYPYPQICVEKEDVNVAILLLDDYASAESELTAVMSYTYGSIIASCEYYELQEAFVEIANVELFHMRLLGETIGLLGVVPRLYSKCNGKIMMWEGSMVPCETDPCELLLQMIEGERRAISQYRRHIDLISDCYVQELLVRIVKDEEVHLKLLLELKQQYFR